MALDQTAVAALCPRCGLRPQEDEVTGFCDPCAGDRAAERYALDEAAAIADRRDAWLQRTRAAREALRAGDRERQRRHRLLERVRPREPAHAHTDPYLLAEEALNHLAKLRAAIRRSGRNLMPELQAAEELVRRLAWGPADLPGPSP